MSFEALDYVYRLRVASNGEAITRDEKHLLLYLAHAHNSDSGAAWPSQETIAKDCMMSKRHVQDLFDSLERKGLVRVIHPEKYGRGRYASYRFPELDARHKRSSMRAPDDGKAHKRCTEQRGKMQEGRSIGAQGSPLIKEELRTENTKTERQFDREPIPEGLDQDRGKYVWSVILKYLECRINPESYMTWLKTLQAVGCADGVLWIHAPSPECKQIVERYTEQIAEGLKSEEVYDIREVRLTC